MRRFIVILAVCGLAACSRYEWVPDYMSPECATTAGTPVVNVERRVTAETVPEMQKGTVRGTVVNAQRGIDNARIILSSVPPKMVNTDSLGRFELQDVSPGRYLIVIRRLGYETARDSVAVPRQGGVRIAVQLEMAMLDGPCSGFGLVQVRKPWWKLW